MVSSGVIVSPSTRPHRHGAADSELPIGILDSGIGGLTIWQSIRRLLPEESFLYVADQANAPYGTRTLPEITDVVLAAARLLEQQGIKLLVVACNTASISTIVALRQAFPYLPVVGIVPAIKPAAALTKTGKIVVCATGATLRSGMYEELKEAFACALDVVDLACDDWVTMAETGRIDQTKLADDVEKIARVGADTVVLGCTHFPLLTPELESLFHVKQFTPRLLDSGAAVARQVKRILEAEDLASKTVSSSTSFCTTGPAATVPRLISDYLEEKITLRAL